MILRPVIDVRPGAHLTCVKFCAGTSVYQGPRGFPKISAAQLKMELLSQTWSFVKEFDQRFVDTMRRHWFTYELVQNPISHGISEVLFVSFVVLFTYELFYWLGIYLNLWEYHAKDIFPDVPVHCAHIYVRLNIADKSSIEEVRKYYLSKLQFTFNLLNWKRINEFGSRIFKLKKFIRYHFEFSPEDFENNPEPEFGSTVEHLRKKTLDLFLSSPVYSKYHPSHTISPDDVFIVNNKNEEVPESHNKTYLSMIHIETGNVIDIIILC